MEETKKSNIFLALLLSLLTAFAGSLLFGLIYMLGYYIYLLSAAIIILSSAVFLKFCKNNKKNLFFSLLWGTIWTFAFNVLLIVVCEGIVLASTYNVSFEIGFKAVIELWKTNPEFQVFMNARLIEVGALILFGGIVYGILYLVRNRKKKSNPDQTPSQKETKHKTSNKNNPTQKKGTSANTPKNQIIEKYDFILSLCKESVKKFSQNKDAEEFKQAVVNIKDNHLGKLTAIEKQTIFLLAVNQYDTETSTLEKKALETLMKISKQQH